MGLPLLSNVAKYEDPGIEVDPDTLKHIDALPIDDHRNREKFMQVGRQIKKLQVRLAADLATLKQLDSVKIRNQIKELEVKRNTLAAFCESEAFESMVMMDVNVEEQKLQNIKILREAEADQVRRKFVQEEERRQNFHQKAFMPSFGLDELHQERDLSPERLQQLPAQ